MGRALEFVAFDLETTGFSVTDEITVAGFVLPLGCRVFCQVPECDAPVPEESTLESTLRERADIHLTLSMHDSEEDLLEAIDAFATERLRDDDVLLVAFNGETFNGGFDLPFLRTRLARTDIEWLFEELPYADLMPVVTNRFNTIVTAESETATDGASGQTHATLPAVYEVLVGGDHGALDPFEDSAAAVEAFEAGDLEELLLHNVSDILRTQALGELAQDYCSKSDFSLKSLTPTSDAFTDGDGGGPGRDGGEPPRP